MDKVSLVKSRLKLEHWKRLIAECQNSNLPVKQWCNNNDVSKDQYYYWLRKIREMTVSEILVPVSDTVSFRRLEVKPPLTGTRQSVMIHLPQATVEVPDGVYQSTVEAVLLALKSTC